MTIKERTFSRIKKSFFILLVEQDCFVESITIQAVGSGTSPGRLIPFKGTLNILRSLSGQLDREARTRMVDQHLRICTHAESYSLKKDSVERGSSSIPLIVSGDGVALNHLDRIEVSVEACGRWFWQRWGWPDHVVTLRYREVE